MSYKSEIMIYHSSEVKMHYKTQKIEENYVQVHSGKTNK